MKIWIVTTESPAGYVGTRASSKEAIELVHEKYPDCFGLGDMKYVCSGMLIVIHEDELPISDDWEDTK